VRARYALVIGGQEGAAARYFVASFPAADPAPEGLEVFQAAIDSPLRRWQYRTMKSTDFIFIIYWFGKIRLPLSGP
jgi:hypothetical protein